MSFSPDTKCPCIVRPASNFNDRAAGFHPSLLILHYTGMPSAQSALDWLCSSQSQVSCHYFVFEDGQTVQLVPESLRAWHAGESFWKGETDINSQSIGIEISNPGHEHGYREFPQEQIKAVIELCKDIMIRRDILPTGVLAHSDIAPNRKQDPGEKFPWRELHESGVGCWVDPLPERTDGKVVGEGCTGDIVKQIQGRLKKIGYRIIDNGIYDHQTRKCIEAFQRHFRPELVDGKVDVSTLTSLKFLAD